MERIKLVEKALAESKGLLSESELHRLLEDATAVLHGEENIVAVNFGQYNHEDGQDSVSRITVVGDTHGQFFDFCNIFHLNGYPSFSHCYVFNGEDGTNSSKRRDLTVDYLCNVVQAISLTEEISPLRL